jgi:hypothetical protein
MGFVVFNHAMYLLAFQAFLRIREISGLPPPLDNCLSVSDIKCLHGDSEGLEIQMSKFKHSLNLQILRIAAIGY